VVSGWWLVVASVAASSACASAPAPPQSACEQVGRARFLPAIPEASGIALGGGVLWTHNDSDAPVLYSIDASGRPMPVTVAGADVRDWEDLATMSGGLCAAGTCLYIADIGDNRESRERITIYEVPVPRAGSTSTTRATATHLRYPDGPHDAEALLVTKRIGIFVITKELPPRVYTFAASQNPGETSTLTLSRTLNENVRITGAAVSPDERWVALRSNRMLFVYTLDDFVNGGEPVRIDLTHFNEPQGEGVTFGSDADLYLVSEGGGKNAAGVLTRIHCAFLR
jgi:hypothetical protein